jgi:hypothetical protein
MADEHDYKRLQAFVEAALTNPRHPLYSIGYAKSELLTHYATNVIALEVIKPEQWFKEYPQYTARLEEAIKILETPEPEIVLPSHDEIMKEVAKMLEPTDSARKKLEEAGVTFDTLPNPPKTYVVGESQPLEEAAMKVKCPKCGEEFSVPMKGV